MKIVKQTEKKKKKLVEYLAIFEDKIRMCSTHAVFMRRTEGKNFKILSTIKSELKRTSKNVTLNAMT